MIAIVCLGRASDMQREAAWPALDEGCPVVAIPLTGGIAAIAARVPEDMFAGESAQQRLSDAAWLRDRAIAHEAIVRTASACGPVLPLAFGTVFRDESSLRGRIEPVACAVQAFLTRIEPYDEYAVKAFADIDRVSTIVAESEAAAVSPGQAYLRRAKLRRHGDGEIDRWLEDRARWIAGELAASSEDLVERRLTQGNDAGQRMVLNAALLVERDHAAALAESIERIGAQLDGIDLELSGPWPLYSFAPTLDASGDDADSEPARAEGRVA